ncbi:hypothetical protein TNIN_474201 [Trichonephila inaurata madagascariensis]|uniref:Transposase n=1 Tax=Trichonephila inaurata madagascariensis TaxID=2747483 RepID=A0A8X7BQV5_9ARAC|nr:hypothetical protein TNIN_474201 [Trichonephila inaurata madagascariensis]
MQNCPKQKPLKLDDWFGDSAANECMARHWFQKFRLGDLSLCDKARTGRPHALDDEALQAVVEKDSSVKRVVNLADNSILPMKRLYLICTA